jgi:AraC-like DNA-binding protein
MVVDPQPFRFRAATPRPPLDRFVESIWSVCGTAPYRRAAVLPNGAVQLMVNFGDPHRVLAFGDRAEVRHFGRTWVAGLQDDALTIEAPPATDLLAIRFRPGGAHAFLPLPVSALTNDVVAGIDVLGAVTNDLRARLAQASDWHTRVAAAENWLLARCRPRERDHALVVRAIDALGTRIGPASVAQTCDSLGLSNRHLIHLFRSIVGLPPKTFARVQRFHAALGELPRVGGRAALAQELGYADQAHFSNEFRRFAGVTPGQYVARRGADDESLILG